MVTIEKCCEIVVDILNNLANSNFACKFGYLAVDGLKDYGLDMAINIFITVNSDENVVRLPEDYNPMKLKEKYFS